MKIIKTILLIILAMLKLLWKLIINILKLVAKKPSLFARGLVIFGFLFILHTCFTQAERKIVPVVEAGYIYDTTPTNTDANDFFIYLDNKSKQGISYQRGGKFGVKIDCSGLLSRFAVGVGLITEDQALHVYNAQKRYHSGSPIDIKDMKRGDLLYRASENKQAYMDHVSVFIKRIDSDTIQIIDAHPTYGVSRRTINVLYTGGVGVKPYSIGNDKVNYYLFPTTNPITSQTNLWTRKYQGEFMATTYVPSTTEFNINNGGGSPTVTASGLPLKDEYAGKIAACPKIYPLNTTTLFVPGLGNVDCKDRGGLITMAGDTNSRGNIAKFNHIDIFAGLDTTKIDFNKRMTDIYK